MADFVTRMGMGSSGCPSPSRPAFAAVSADPPGDTRGEEGDAGQPGEQAHGETGDVEQLDQGLQRGDPVALEATTAGGPLARLATSLRSRSIVAFSGPLGAGRKCLVETPG